MAKQRPAQAASPPRPSANPLPNARTQSPGQKKNRALWQTGALFHVTFRYPRKRNTPRVDRLAGILQRGLLAPAQSPDGLVLSDLSIVATGFAVPYDSLVFLHRFDSASYIYTNCQRGRFAVFVDPALPVLTQEAMGPNWPVLCQDEVYVRDAIAPEQLTGIAVHPADADAVLTELIADFQRLALPLYDYDGNVLA